MSGKIRLSSGSTWFYKHFFLPGMPVLFLLVGAQLFWFDSDIPKLQVPWFTIVFVVASLVMGMFLIPISIQMKDVYVRDQEFVVSHFLKTIEVPFANLKSVDVNYSFSLLLIKVTFYERTEFGASVRFVSDGWTLTGFSKSYDLLKEIIDENEKTKETA